jgi:aminoglycoside 3-N-acetyltransferase
MTIGYQELKSAFDSLGLSDKFVIAHASLKPFGYIDHGAETIVRAMIDSFKGVLMPTFTYKTMVTPEVGPPNNGITYGAEKDMNKMAQPFTPDMPADKMMGNVPEALRKHSSATRTSHPILSLAGVNVDHILDTQTIDNPLDPIGALAEEDGWVVLINVDHSVNTSIHYAEKLAGRRQFIRWAVVENRIVECSSFPGDSSGFNVIEEYLKPDIRRVLVDNGFIQAVSLKRLLDTVQGLIKQNPLALLCQRTDCERCNAVRGM